jgi:F0F1-type ATP synthase epsilon subunit
MPGEKKTEDTFRVTIRTPDSLVWQGRALSVSSANNKGVFDILPEHANLITLIDNQPITISTETGTRKFMFEKAVLSFKDNAASIYANISQGQKQQTSDKPSNS